MSRLVGVKMGFVDWVCNGLRDESRVELHAYDSTSREPSERRMWRRDD